YGLMRYRRLLHFAAKDDGCYFFHDVTDKEIQKFGWSPDAVQKVCSRYDIITGPLWNIHPSGLPGKVMNARDFYARE
ncbi:hypothetical protein K4H00_27230, partial [Mycobacterium tuberculosis]|nr:hypothetical protein [Mycobacterium tuberculosis]